MIIRAFSRALYSSWYYYAPDRILLDCGEGAGLYLRQDIFAIEKIFLSHGHVDHIAGLLPLICLRQGTKGDNLKPLAIYYPEGENGIEIFKRTITEMLGNYVRFPLEWITLTPGSRVELRKGRFMETFAARRHAERPLIYVVTEQRKRLKEELHGAPGPELAKIADKDKYDYRDVKILAYSGDSMPVDPAVYREVEILIHECTFLREDDRKYPIHSAIQEVFDLARDARVKRLILTHISPRYFRREIPELIHQAENHGIDYAWVDPDRVTEF